MNRRELVKASILAVLGGLSRRGRGLAAGRKLERIGLQLYTVRNELQKDFEGTLAQVAALGYQEVEFIGYFGRSPATIRDILEDLGLTSPSSHTTVPALRQDTAKNIEVAKEIGNRYLVCVVLFPNERQSLDDYKRHAAFFNQVGEACHKAGMQFAYHNHDFEFAPLEGEIPYHVLLQETDPELVKMEIDLYWMTKGNQRPTEYFTDYPGRFPLFHIKDMDDTPRRFFTEVGRGIIDFQRIFAHNDLAGAKHFFVEQDVTSGPALESARISLEFLRQLEY